ncbi:MAG: tripartite tricarboxylate transporter substrate binding protein [Burkholderiaceae bacterium]
MSMFRKTLMGVLVAAALLPAHRAMAQTYPNKPVHMVIPFAAGGRVEAIGRMVCDGLSRELGQPCVIDIKAGAGGAIGAEYVANSRPDGYTLLLASAGIMAILPHVQKKLAYDPRKDFTAVSRLVVGFTYIGVNKDVKAQTFADLVAMAKEKPGTVGYATSGIGTYGHLAGELMTQAAGAPMIHVPYKGTGAAIADILAGHVPVMIAGELGDLAKSGGVRILATTNQVRPPDFPNVPTMKELGYPQFVADSWIGLFAAAGLDPAITQKLNVSIAKTLNNPEIAAKIRGLGSDVAFLEGPGLAKQVNIDLEIFGDVIRKAGLKFE